jgi:hypothetical protein
MLYDVAPATAFHVTVASLFPGVTTIPVGIAGAGAVSDEEPPLPHAVSSMMSKPAIHKENSLQRNRVIVLPARAC